MRCCVLLLVLLLKPVAADRRLLLFTAVEPHMGTLMQITLYAESQHSATIAFRAAFDRIHQLDEILSDYKPESELNTVCRTAVGQRVRVSDDLFGVLLASQKLSEESEGAFDVTLGPVIRLWRSARRQHKVPAPEDLQKAAGRCGYHKLHLDLTDHTAMLDLPDMQLDLGGIAKGYAADEGLAVLSGLGIHSALIAASGDLAFSDPPPGKPGWAIGLAGSADVLTLRNGAVSTSGDAEQHLEIQGRRYSHVIDPATNMGLTTSITVIVVATRGIEADAVATAVSVLGPERGFRLVEKHPGMAVRVLTPGGSIDSPRFARLR